MTQEVTRTATAVPAIDSILVHHDPAKPTVYKNHGATTLMNVGFTPGQLTADSVQRLRAKLAVAQKALKRPDAFANLITVLDALSASTPEEYHRRIARLPVQVVVARADQGARRDYYVKGRLTMSLFEESAPPAAPDASPVSGPSDRVSARSALDCEYTDDYGTWDGDCADQQAIDDAAASIAAVEADLLQAYADCVAAVESDEDCGELAPEQRPGGTLNVEAAVGGPFDPGMFGPRTCPDYGEYAIGVSYEVPLFVAARGAAWQVLARGVAASALEVGIVVAGVALSGMAVGFAIGHLINCVVD